MTDRDVIDPVPVRIKAGADLDRRLMSVLTTAHPLLRAEGNALRRARRTDPAATAPLRDFVLAHNGERMPFCGRVNVAGYLFTGLLAPATARFAPSKPGGKTLANNVDFNLEVGPVVAKGRVRVPGSKSPPPRPVVVAVSRPEPYPSVPPIDVRPPAASTAPAPRRGQVRVFLGRTGGAEIHWAPDELMNFGIQITGDSGSGKTQTSRAIIDEAVRGGLPVCVFDFKGDYADRPFAEPLGLTVLDVNRDGLPFNPLALIPDEIGEVQPIRRAHEIGGILGRVFGLGSQQESRLKKAIASAYQRGGIVPRQRHRLADLPSAPGFGAVFDVLDADNGAASLLSRLSALFDLDLFPNDEAIGFERLLSERVVFDLHRLPNDQIKGAMAEFVVLHLHGHVLRGEQPRELRRLLVFDEAWRLRESEHLQELAREGRAFGVGIILATQFPSDVPATMAGNLETQIFLHNAEAAHQRAIVKALGGGATVIAQRLGQHQALLRNSRYKPFAVVDLVPHYRRESLAATE